MAAQPQHAQIHLGPGRLGLGLVVLTTIESGIDVHLVAREESKLEPDGLSVTLYYEEAPPQQFDPLDVGSLSPASCIEQLHDDAREALETCPNLLVTTSLTTAGLSECRDFIVELLSHRPADLLSTTVFIAAENDPGPHCAELEEHLTSLGVDCRRTMVNRLCYLPEGTGSETRRDVLADGLAEWLIEGSPDQEILEMLSMVGHVRFVDDLRPFETRKRWLVNGGHLALALWARDDGIVSLDEAASEPLRSEWLERFHAPMARALERRWPELENSAEYALDHVRAWARHHDDVDRVLRRLQRADLIPFLDDVDRKLADLVEPLFGAGEPWPELEETFYRIHALLGDFNSYCDAIDIEKGEVVLSEQGDRAALARYSQLISKVLPKDEVLRMVRQLERAFAQHR